MSKHLYYNRIIEQQLEAYLNDFDLVYIEGILGCGKSFTSKQFANSITCNTNNNKQQILTCSSKPQQPDILLDHTNRIAYIQMKTMSLYESKDSTGIVSLYALFNGSFKACLTNEIHLTDLIYYIIRGGFPSTLNVSSSEALIINKEHLSTIIKEHALHLDGIKRDEKKLNLLLQTLAKHESSTVSNRFLQKEIKDINIGTIPQYLDLLKRVFLIDPLEPFPQSNRSNVRIKQSIKHHFTDPSLICALHNATKQTQLDDLETLKTLFESLCIRDLKIYANAIGGELYHYQDYKNREIDAVVQLEDGRWGAFEIKLGAHQIDQAAKSLLQIKQEFSEDPKATEPDILCVICGMSNAAYQRNDGVYVIPITVLKD